MKTTKTEHMFIAGRDFFQETFGGWMMDYFYKIISDNKIVVKSNFGVSTNKVECYLNEKDNVIEMKSDFTSYDLIEGEYIKTTVTKSRTVDFDTLKIIS